MSKDKPLGRKKSAASGFTNPSLVSPTTPTLANPTRGFGSQTNTAPIQKLAEVSPNFQEAQSADEPLLEIEAIKEKPLSHDISRISLRSQAKLTVSQSGDKYEQEADMMANQVMSMPQMGNVQTKLATDSTTQIQRDPSTNTNTTTQPFTPVVAQPQPPTDIELNKEFAMPVKISNADKAPASTTFEWSWIDLDGKLEKGEATSTSATSSLKAKPKKVGDDSIAAKVIAKESLLPGAQQILGEVESPTATLKIPEVEVVWGEKISAGNTGGGKERDIASDPMKIYRNDTITITAELNKITEPEKAGVKFAIAGSGVGMKVEELPTATWAGNKATWAFKAAKAGLINFDISGQVPGSAVNLSHISNFKVVMDLTDLTLTCQTASTLIDAKWHRAAKMLEDATTAFEDAKKKHQGVLKKASQAQELVGELLMGAFFAGLGGFAGGAVGTVIKDKLGKPLADSALGGGLTDAGKDTMKYATRALQKLGAGSSKTKVDSSDTGTGSSGPAGSDKGGGIEGVGSDPTRWARGISSKLHGEVATVKETLAGVLDAARNADRDTEFDNLEGDPVASIQSDETITALEGVSTKEGDYAKGLWKTWLENYAYQFWSVRDKDSGATIGDIKSNVDDTFGKMREGINEAAAQCSESGDVWINTYGGTAYLKASKQKKQKEWQLEHPDEPLPDDLKDDK